MFSFHEKLSISEYLAEATKLEVKNCPEHRLAYVLGCKTCFSILCMQCMTKDDSCTFGEY